MKRTAAFKETLTRGQLGRRRRPAPATPTLRETVGFSKILNAFNSALGSPDHPGMRGRQRVVYLYDSLSQTSEDATHRRTQLTAFMSDPFPPCTRVGYLGVVLRVTDESALASLYGGFGGYACARSGVRSLLLRPVAPTSPHPLRPAYRHDDGLA